MRILTFTTLYPSAARPHHGVFVEERLRHLVDAGTVTARVVAPVPWFPWRHPRFGAYGRLAATPARDTRFAIPIVYPRYPVIPKLGMSAAPFLLHRATLGTLRRALAGGNGFDLIDAHYFYPDGVAAVMAGRRLGRPVVITARGTDINLVPEHAVPRRLIVWAARHAAAMVTVCQALKDRLVALGVPEGRVTVLRNGVDLDLFRPCDPAPLRARLAVTGPLLLSVGHLIARKGHDLAIRALAEIPGAHLLIVGEGPEGPALRRLAGALGLTDRVTFAGAVPHGDMAAYYSAADLLVLASSREGWANVLLEAMACGTPVVATEVWGTPEVVTTPAAGLLMEARTPEALAAAARRLLSAPPPPAATRAHAEGFGWEATTRGQTALFRAVLDREAGR